MIRNRELVKVPDHSKAINEVLAKLQNKVNEIKEAAPFACWFEVLFGHDGDDFIKALITARITYHRYAFSEN